MKVENIQAVVKNHETVFVQWERFGMIGTTSGRVTNMGSLGMDVQGVDGTKFVPFDEITEIRGL